jgi:hypothetical protein
MKQVLTTEFSEKDLYLFTREEVENHKAIDNNKIQQAAHTVAIHYTNASSNLYQFYAYS